MDLICLIETTMTHAKALYVRLWYLEIHTKTQAIPRSIDSLREKFQFTARLLSFSLRRSREARIAFNFS